MKGTVRPSGSGRRGPRAGTDSSVACSVFRSKRMARRVYFRPVCLRARKRLHAAIVLVYRSIGEDGGTGNF